MTKLPENFKFKSSESETIYTAVIEGGDPAMVRITWVWEKWETAISVEPVSRYPLSQVQRYVETGVWVIVG